MGHMEILKKIVLLGGFLCCHMLSFSQGYVVSPTVPDFMDLNARCVVATCGYTSDPFFNTGVINGRHTVISQQGTDPMTGGGLKLIPEGASKVIRLGNKDVGAEAESITYHFIADAERSILLLRFAVAFEDPSHNLEAQPRFKVRIMNKKGELIESCAEYDVSARAEIEGFQTYNRGWLPVRWRDWTNIGLDMSAYAGQEVQVQFVTYDCEYSGHCGYAYFTASCISNKLSLADCSGADFTVAAPEGFPSYLWQNGETGSSTHWVKGATDMNLTCKITSVTGCVFTLSGYVSAGGAPTEGEIIHDTICEGDSYVDHYYNLPPQTEVGHFTYYNTFCDLTTCRADATSILFLTVQQRYFPVEARICQGMDYVEHGFNFRQPERGVYYDTIRYVSTAGCDSIIPLKLVVDFSFDAPNHITGDANPCYGTVAVYSVPDVKLSYYNWSVPAGFYILGSGAGGNVRVQVTDRAEAGTIVFQGGNGCGTGQIILDVNPNPSYWKTLADTVCLGEEFHEKGFHIPVKDSAGIYSFVQYHSTRRGCDSTVVLHLSVFPNPSVRIRTTDSVLCAGSAVTLHALGGSFSFDPQFVPKVALGDILCEGDEIIKPDKYNGSGKTAVGIVFWVDRTGEHGWAVDPKNEIPAIWSMVDRDIPDLFNYGTYPEVCADTSGYANTKIIRANGNSTQHPAAWTVDFEQGWYIPASGQLNQLFGVIYDLAPSILLVGGTPFFGTALSYWTSSEYNNNSAWGVSSDGEILKYIKGKRGWLRPVRSF